MQPGAAGILTNFTGGRHGVEIGDGTRRGAGRRGRASSSRRSFPASRAARGRCARGALPLAEPSRGRWAATPASRPASGRTLRGAIGEPVGKPALRRRALRRSTTRASWKAVVKPARTLPCASCAGAGSAPARWHSAALDGNAPRCRWVVRNQRGWIQALPGDRAESKAGPPQVGWRRPGRPPRGARPANGNARPATDSRLIQCLARRPGDGRSQLRRARRRQFLAQQGEHATPFRQLRIGVGALGAAHQQYELAALLVRHRPPRARRSRRAAPR